MGWKRLKIEALITSITQVAHLVLLLSMDKFNRKSRIDRNATLRITQQSLQIPGQSP